jgi:drug/metabolite transporter (DMT)-like permease
MPELSPELVAVLAAFVGMVVAEGLQQLSRLLDRDFSGNAAALTAAIVSLLVAIVNGLLGQVPPAYVPFVNGFLAFLVIVLGPMAFHSFVSKFARAG